MTGQTAQISRRRADVWRSKVEVAINFDVDHHDRQHLLVDVIPAINSLR